MARVYSSTSVATTLANALTNIGTSITVTSGTGAALIQGAGFINGDIFTIAIDPDTQSEEICYITANSGDTFTITRAQGGSSAIAHAAGAAVKHVLASPDLDYFRNGVVTADAAIPKATVTTKGDLIATNASGAPVRLAVGSSAQVLTVDSSTSTSLKWATPAVTTLDISYNSQTGTTYTLASTDVNKLVTLDNANPITVTVPSGTFTQGQQVNLQQIGAGQVTVSGSGTTITGTGTKLRAQYSAATLLCTSSNNFTLIGDIS